MAISRTLPLFTKTRNTILFRISNMSQTSTIIYRPEKYDIQTKLLEQTDDG